MSLARQSEKLSRSIKCVGLASQNVSPTKKVYGLKRTMPWTICTFMKRRHLSKNISLNYSGHNCYSQTMPTPLLPSPDAHRWRPTDPATLANDLEFVATELDSAMLAAGGEDFTRLYQAAKRIGDIADRGLTLAELD